jgi:arylsulfatase
MSGKWHVGGFESTRPEDCRQAGQPGSPRPIDRGFDHHYGTLAGAGSYYLPHALIRDTEFVQPEGADYYYTDAIGDNAAGCW